jgi:anaerobic magnesium-protoporphyrin IX monomethyl ester cyclase
MGVESGSQRILDIINKGESVDTIKQAVRMLHAAGVRVKGFFIIGLPGETEESLQETRNFLDEMDLYDIDAKIFQPYPGSPIWDEKARFDIDWSDQDPKTTFYKGRPKEYYGTIRTSAMTTDQIYKAWVDIEAQYKRLWTPEKAAANGPA